MTNREECTIGFVSTTPEHLASLPTNTMEAEVAALKARDCDCYRTHDEFCELRDKPRQPVAEEAGQ